MKNKISDLKKGNYIIENKEKLLYKRKRKRKRKHLILLAIVMLTLLITLCLKLPHFNIISTEIRGNEKVSISEINKSSDIIIGKNIFNISFNGIKSQILKNPYVLGVKIKKVIPNRVIIEIEERVAVFYGQVNNNYYILDNKGILLEKRTSIKDMNLVNLIGFDYAKCEVGNLIVSEDNRKISIANEITNLLNTYKKNNSKSTITKVDVSDVVDLKIFSGEMCIKFGTSEDLKNKFNRAINIISQPQFKIAKGYIDVSFRGNPVVFIEK